MNSQDVQVQRAVLQEFRERAGTSLDAAGGAAVDDQCAALSERERKTRAEFAARFARYDSKRAHKEFAAAPRPRAAMKTTALFSIKGGVGKTAAAVNLAHLAARGGARTLLWDLDPQGAASFYLRIRPKLTGGSRRLLERKNRLGEAIKASDFTGLDVIRPTSRCAAWCWS